MPSSLAVTNRCASSAHNTSRLGRRDVRVIQANIAFALGVKALFHALALTGYTSLWLAILADTGVT